MALELWRWSASALVKAIASREITSRETVQSHLDRMAKVNPGLNAVVLTLTDEALASADAADAAILRGEPPGTLHGVPITTKLTSDQKGCPSDNGVVFLKDNIAPEDSAVVANLRKAGAVIIGRTNSPGFAIRAHTDNMLHGATLNPWNADVTPGGSSGGAGAALAAGIGAIAHGSDIGGSIRWPAFCNGVVGLRPSRGRIPSYNPTFKGDRAFASQLMAVNGPMARNVADVALAFRPMSVGDPRDPLWVAAMTEWPALPNPIGVALYEAPSDAPIGAAARESVRRAGEILTAAGFSVEVAAPPDLDRLTSLWHTIAQTELRTSMEPVLAKTGDRALETFLRCWWEIVPPPSLADYLSALQERDTILRRWRLFMERYPIVILPSCPHDRMLAGADAGGLDAARQTFEILRFQLPIPVLGLPSLAVPVGMHQGMPQGVQIVSRLFREDLCFCAGQFIEAEEPSRTPID